MALANHGAGSGAPLIAAQDTDPASQAVSTLLPGDRVVHLAGTVTEAVFSFLGPASAALAECGVEQTVVLLDDRDHRHLLPRFHEAVRLEPCERTGSRPRDLMNLRNKFQSSLEADEPRLIHAHGVIPLMIAGTSKAWRHSSSRLMYSPHGSAVLRGSAPVGAMVSFVARQLAGKKGHATVANVSTDVRRLHAISQQPVELLESPVPACYLEAVVAPSRRPLLVTSSRSAEPTAAALFAQCAVLLGDHQAAPSLRWVGGADTESIARLQAAEVQVIDALSDPARITQMKSAWAYLALGGPNGFPIHLAEAMAMGLPCIAWDQAYYHDVITHGENGLLCRDMDDVLAAVDLLLTDRVFALELGRMARQTAARRFDLTTFDSSVMSLYSSQL